MQLSKKTFSQQRGFSLIEALVAFLVLSIGLLGIASLQVISLKAGHTAALRTVAVIKTEEMMERIRNNPTVIMDYIANVGDPGENFACNDSTGSINMCTQVQMARDDIYNWKLDLKTSLPNNSGTTASIGVVAPTPGTIPTAAVTVTVNWQERNPETQTMDNMTYAVSSHICDNTGC